MLMVVLLVWKAEINTERRCITVFVNIILRSITYKSLSDSLIRQHYRIAYIVAHVAAAKL